MIKPKIYENLSKAFPRIDQVENYLLEQIPNAFLNFIDLDLTLTKSIIEKHKSLVESELNKNRIIYKTALEYIKIAEYLYEDLKIKSTIQYDYAATIPVRFLMAQTIIRKALRIYDTPNLAKYRLLRILSKSEKSIFPGIQSLAEEMPDIAFNISDWLMIDNYGNFDTQSTIEYENKFANIRKLFSSLSNLDDQLIEVKYRLDNDSKYMFFHRIHTEIGDSVCNSALEAIRLIYVDEIYKLFQQNNPILLAKDQVKRNFQIIANEYLQTGDSQNDIYGIAEDIYIRVGEELENSNIKLKNDFIQEFSLEIMRIVFDLIINWIYMPANFYYLDFRQADDSEKIAPEVTHVLDVYRIEDANNINRKVVETYAITFTENVKNTLDFMSNKGIKNPTNIQKYIDISEEPNPWKRFKTKLEKIAES